MTKQKPITFEDCIKGKHTFKELVDYEKSQITFWAYIKEIIAK